jgi:hypothetical protein
MQVGQGVLVSFTFVGEGVFHVYLKVHILVRVPHSDVLWAGVSSSIHQLYKLYTANIVQIL